MAKKSKINQKIKKYFNEDPFDVGIVRVSTATLSELFATLGIHDVDQNREMLIKIARMVWSDVDSGYRPAILDFFTKNGKVYKDVSPEELSVDRESKIELVMDNLGVSRHERALLHKAFVDVRSKKITIEKMESKLRHIRYTEKKERLEKALDGVFDLDDSLEFNASLKYTLYGESFHKIITLSSKPFSYEYIEQGDENLIIDEISQDKERVVKLKQSEIDSFIKNLQNPHRYLDHKEIITALRSSPPKTKLSYPNIKESKLAQIVHNRVGSSHIKVHNEELLIQQGETLRLPYSSRVQNYSLELHVELNSLLEDIWKGNELDFSEAVKEAKKEHEEQFLQDLQAVVDECGSYATLLHLSKEQLHERVYEILLELLPSSLVLSSKVIRKCIRRFVHNIGDEIVKKQRYTLLARTIRDFKNLFPQARSMKRKLILHIGPTNSGKTYQAMQRLQNADTGYYLAPLRLLALEGYEELGAKGVAVSLITGEEQILDADATHISSTIEMLNFEVDVDVCVIDEVQMIDDRDRGWAWANAIIGAPASEIIMTGSTNVKEAIIAIAEYLGEELEIIEFERKNPLTLLEEPTMMKDVKESTAIIAFSRREVLKLKQNFSKHYKISVVYGNLSPEVRREEARRFRAGETQILIATDAIAMGMNLPIKTILFSSAQKFDGVSVRDLDASEVHQISGRAGRFGLHEEGFVGALSSSILKIVKKCFQKEARKISVPFKVMANLEHIQLVATILEENSLSEILKFFVQNMEFNGPFVATNLEDMVEVALIVDSYDLDIATKYHLACAPLTLKSPYIVGVFESYLSAFEKKIPIDYHAPRLQGAFASTSDDLLRAEDMVKEISLYLWLGYRFDDIFPDAAKARSARAILNKYIEESLQQSQLAQRCKICNIPLPLNSPYSICQSCFKKNYTVKGIRKNARKQH